MPKIPQVIHKNLLRNKGQWFLTYSWKRKCELCRGLSERHTRFWASPFNLSHSSVFSSGWLLLHLRFLVKDSKWYGSVSPILCNLHLASESIIHIRSLNLHFKPPARPYYSSPCSHLPYWAELPGWLFKLNWSVSLWIPQVQTTGTTQKEPNLSQHVNALVVWRHPLSSSCSESNIPWLF